MSVTDNLRRRISKERSQGPVGGLQQVVADDLQGVEHCGDIGPFACRLLSDLEMSLQFSGN